MTIYASAYFVSDGIVGRNNCDLKMNNLKESSFRDLNVFYNVFSRKSHKRPATKGHSDM